MTLGNRISELRKQKNYSQEYIAEILDISRQAVYKWEKDLSSPDTAHLIKLAEILGVSVEYLAAGKSDYSSVEDKQKRKKKNTLFKAVISLSCILLAVFVLFIIFAITRPVSWDAYACSGGFETHIWNKYKDELFEKYNNGFNDNFSRELINDSHEVIFKDRTIVFFFDVDVTDDKGDKWTDYVHVVGKRYWTEKYLFNDCIISEKLSSENYFGSRE